LPNVQNPIFFLIFSSLFFSFLFLPNVQNPIFFLLCPFFQNLCMLKKKDKHIRSIYTMIHTPKAEGNKKKT